MSAELPKPSVVSLNKNVFSLVVQTLSVAEDFGRTLIVVPKSLDATSLPLPSATCMNEVEVIPISKLEERAAADNEKGTFSWIIMANSLISAPDYKKKLMVLHKLLKDDGCLMTFNLQISAERQYTDIEVQTLSDLFGYDNGIMNSSIIQGKLQKYCFDAVSIVNVSQEIISKPLDKRLESILNEERVTFFKTIFKKKFDHHKVLVPRVRDKNGYRARASAIIFRKKPSPSASSPSFNPQNSNLELLLLKRRTKGWTFPGGGVEEQEKVEAAVIRECFEETGAICSVVDRIGTVTDPKKKTITEVFLMVLEEEKEEYPEDNRIKKWFAVEEIQKHYETIESTEFFGKGSVTTKAMLKMTWDALQSQNL